MTQFPQATLQSNDVRTSVVLSQCLLVSTRFTQLFILSISGNEKQLEFTMLIQFHFLVTKSSNLLLLFETCRLYNVFVSICTL